MNRYNLCFVFLFFTCCSFQAWAQRSSSFVPDGFGYQTEPTCPFTTVDISTTGQSLDFTDTNGAITTDDGVAAVQMVRAFEYYQQLYTTLLVSTNGYVTLSNTDGSDNGADFSNDCPLPAAPDNGTSELARIAVLHDDLELTAPEAGVFTEFFTICPRDGLIPIEPCQIIQWQALSYRNQPGTETFSLQLLLYPASRQIVMQYPGNNHDTQSATIGLQSTRGISAVNQGCNATPVIPENGALCITHPLSTDILFRGGFELFSVE